MTTNSTLRDAPQHAQSNDAHEQQHRQHDAPSDALSAAEQALLRAFDERRDRKLGRCCGHCAHAERWISERGTDLHFIRCALSVKWRYRPRVAFCQFSPSRWRAAADPKNL